MKVNLGIWGWLTRVVMILLVICSLLGLFLWSLPNIRQNQRMRHRNLELEARIEEQEQLNKQLQNSLESIRNNPKTVERLAREKLGYAKPGETVIRFEDGKTN